MKFSGQNINPLHSLSLNFFIHPNFTSCSPGCCYDRVAVAGCGGRQAAMMICRAPLKASLTTAQAAHRRAQVPVLSRGRSPRFNSLKEGSESGPELEIS